MAEQPGALRRQAAHSARWMTVATATRVVTQLAQVVILGRLLVPEDFGLMAMVMFVVVFGQAVGDAGISNAVIHYQDATRRELSSLFWLNVGAGAAVFALVWLGAPLFALIYHEPRLVGLVHLSAVVFLVMPVGQLFQVLSEKGLLFRRLALIEIVAALAGLGVAVWCALTGLGVYALVWGMLAQAGVKAVALAVAGWKQWQPSLVFAWRECRRFLRFGLFQMGDRVLNQMGAQVDRFLLGVILGARPLGFYNVAYNLALRPFLLINPIVTRVAFPVFARVQTRNEQLRSGFLQMIELIAAVLVPLYAALIVLAEPIIYVGPSAKFAPAIPMLRVLGVVGMVLSLGNPMGSLILAKGRPGISFGLGALRLALDVAAVSMAAHMGAVAVAVAVLIVRAGIMFPVGFFIRWLLVRMRPGEYLATLAPFFFSSAVMSAVMWSLEHWVVWPSHLVELVVCLAAGGVVYAGLLLVFDRARVMRIIGNVRS